MTHSPQNIEISLQNSCSRTEKVVFLQYLARIRQKKQVNQMNTLETLLIFVKGTAQPYGR